MSLIYKALFEVKLMHEFFITDQNGVTKFDEPDPQKRIDFLLLAHNIDRESINSDLLYEFPEEFETEYAGYHLKLLSTYSGFKVVVRVNKKILPDNSVVYEPVVTLPNDLNIYVRLTKKNNLTDSYTNSRISRCVPSQYFFSNENLPGAKTFPYLTNSVSAHNTAYSYEQGELASFGANDLRSFFINGGGETWNPEKGNAFANENDRLLVPLRFDYSFDSAAEITQAKFVVKNKNGDAVKTISMDAIAPAEKIRVDFFDKPDLLSLPDKFSFSDYLFSLEVTGSGGYSKTHPVIFSDLLYGQNAWAMIDIRTAATNTLFNLIGSDGFLKKRIDGTGTPIEAPVFQIPIKSRFGFWRYVNDKNDALDLIPDLDDYLLKDDKVLLTKKPRRISKFYFMVQNEAGTATKYLPNPINYDIQKDSKERFCFDIKVPRSELFPVI